MSTEISVSAKEALTFNSTQRTIYGNLSKLVQYLQMEYGGGWEESSTKALVNPAGLMHVAETSDNADLLSDTDISNAMHPVVLIDGIPTVSDLPVWDRLSGEPLHYFNVFQRYLKMKEERGMRSISKVAEEYQVSPRDINLLSKIYHWQYRVIPYDKQMEAARAMRRQREADLLDESLGKTARDLIQVASMYLDNHQEQLSPKMAIELMKVMVPIARVAVGLPGNAPIEERKTGGGSGGSGKTDVNVNINNAVGENATAGSVHGLSESDVINKMTEQNNDPSTQASILNVLIKSGAMESTVLNESDAIDADFVEEGDSNESETY